MHSRLIAVTITNRFTLKVVNNENRVLIFFVVYLPLLALVLKVVVYHLDMYKSTYLV